MLKIILSDELMKEKHNIKDQIQADIEHEAFNRDLLTIQHFASAFDLYPDQEIMLK